MKAVLGITLALLASPALAEEAKKESVPAKPAAKTERVKLTTSKGDITIELNREKAPITVENFVSYVKKGHYDGTVFHRVIGNFMIQGGGFDQKGDKLVEKATGKPIKNEAANGLKNDKGTIAMARTGNPDSATSQFFINVVDNNGLNRPNPDGHGYAVFGKVVEGMDVVEKIKAAKTGTQPLTMRTPDGREITQPARDVPTEAIVIKSAKMVE